MKNNTGRIPISLFTDVHQTHSNEFEKLEWIQIVEMLRDSAATPTASKSDAPLMASAEFEDGRRLKAKARKSGMVILDVDDGATVREATEIIHEMHLKTALYTTASHTDEHHKFRVCVPLTEPVDAELYTKAWHGINILFNEIADPSKKGCESLFYLPGQYPNVPNHFESFSGDVASAIDWAAVVPNNSVKNRIARTKTRTPKQKCQLRSKQKNTLPEEQIIGRSPYENPLITESAMDTYLDTSRNWYHAKYRLMCSISGRAEKFGFPLNSSQLVEIFLTVDNLDGGYYSSGRFYNELHRDAENALMCAAQRGE